MSPKTSVVCAGRPPQQQQQEEEEQEEVEEEMQHPAARNGKAARGADEKGGNGRANAASGATKNGGSIGSKSGSGSSNKGGGGGTPQLPSASTWSSAVRLLMERVFRVSEDESGGGRDRESRLPRAAALSKLIDPEMSLSISLGQAALPLALEMYSRALPPYYTRAVHEAHVVSACARVDDLVVGPALEATRNRLRRECLRLWEGGRQMCECRSLTGRPCTLRVHQLPLEEGQDPPGGLAAASGLLRVGDRLLSVNGVMVRGHAVATSALKSTVGELRLRILRAGGEASTKDKGEASAKDKGEASAKDKGEASAKDKGRGRPRRNGRGEARHPTRREEVRRQRRRRRRSRLCVKPRVTSKLGISPRRIAPRAAYPRSPPPAARVAAAAAAAAQGAAVAAAVAEGAEAAEAAEVVEGARAPLRRVRHDLTRPTPHRGAPATAAAPSGCATIPSAWRPPTAASSRATVATSCRTTRCSCWPAIAPPPRLPRRRDTRHLLRLR